MTRAEFVKKLSKLKGRGWRITGTGAIRCKRGWCPIIAVARAEGIRIGHNSIADGEPSERLRLRGASDIMDSADSTVEELKRYNYPRGGVRLRRDMLRVLGLSEVAP